jgi:hypothetical protein
LIKNQRPSLPLTAMLDCVCGEIFWLRAAMQFAQEQFHCGRPPPAALPRTRMRIELLPLGSDGARVTRALEKDRHAFHCGFNPFFPGAFHQRQRPFISRQPWELAIPLYLLSSKISGHAF